MGATTLEQKTEHATWVTYTRGDESHQTVVHPSLFFLRGNIAFSGALPSGHETMKGRFLRLVIEEVSGRRSL